MGLGLPPAHVLDRWLDRWALRIIFGAYFVTLVSCALGYTFGGLLVWLGAFTFVFLVIVTWLFHPSSS